MLVGNIPNLAELEGIESSKARLDVLTSRRFCVNGLDLRSLTAR
ncbi:MAG: hypothetical protein AAFY11_00430 [Cyanobacteria bacterium J06641_5]